MSTDQAIDAGKGAGEIMLFGVRLVVDSMRKSVSLNNLLQYEHRLDASSTAEGKDNDKDVAADYASADETVHRPSTTSSAISRERKRGVPWTEEEHKLFLIGLEKVGKGDWRGISRNFVKTRTPTQVASHAQKYFLRRSNLNRRRRRSSLFDITTDTIVKDNNGGGSQTPFPSMQASSEISNLKLSKPETSEYPTAPIYPMEMNSSVLPAACPMSSKSMAELEMNENKFMDPSPLSLNLSLSISSDFLNSPSSSSSRRSAFPVVQSISKGDSIISVA